MVNHHSNTHFSIILPCLENTLAYINVASHARVLFSPSLQGRNASPPKNVCVGGWHKWRSIDFGHDSVKWNLGELVGSKPGLVKKYRFKRCVQLTTVKSFLDGHLWDNSYWESMKKSIEAWGPTQVVCLLQVFVKKELTLFIDGCL